MAKVALWIFSFILMSMVFESMALPYESDGNILDTIQRPNTINEDIAQTASSNPYKAITPHKSLFIYGAPYSSQTNGEYVLQSDAVNGYPVYKKEGTAWSFYQRTDQKWYLDFNDVNEDWDGTVMYSETAGFSPELLEYSNEGFVFANKVISTGLVPYHNGDYTFEGEIYNNAPVYTATNNFHMYRRSTGDVAGHWVIDYNDIDEKWSGTIAYTVAPSLHPYGTQWNN